MRKLMKSCRTAMLFTVTMLLLCGLLYPLALTATAQVTFPDQANGSLIEVDGKVVGSAIVGQDFDDARFFKCRPSAYNYNTYTTEEKEDGTYAGVASGSNNYAPSNPDLQQRIEEDINAFLEANPNIKKNEIPVDLVTASGSGLDPHISPEGAMVQIDAIAKASGLTKVQLETIIENNTTHKLFGIFGQESVNVLHCNLEIAKSIGMI